MIKRPTTIAVKILAIAALTILGGCVGPEIAVNQNADFSQIKRVAVAAFSGPGGEAAADMLAMDLLARGADVVERQRLNEILKEQQLGAAGTLDPATIKKIGKVLGVDAIFVGTVVDVIPNQSYLITTGEDAIAWNTVTPVNGSTFYSRGPASGLSNSEVVTSAANVSLISRMVDTETGSILWSARMNYEGWDTQTAMSEITEAFATSLGPLWPAIQPLRRR